MKKTGFYKNDWFIALLIGLAFSAAILGGAPLLSKLEYLAYDAGVRMTPRAATAAENLAIIEIDDTSIDRIGRWPWPRSVLADMVERLARAEVRAVGLLIFLTEPQVDQGLTYIRNLRSYMQTAALNKTAKREAHEIRQMLEQAERDLDVDGALTRALPAARNLYLPMFATIGTPLGKPDSKLPDYVRRSRLTKIVAPAGSAAHVALAESVLPPLAQFGEQVAGIGHLASRADADGGTRTAQLVLDYDGDYYAALPLLLAAAHLNLGPGDIALEPNEGLRLGRLVIHTNPRMQMYTGFYPWRNGEKPFRAYSFYDVLSEKVPVTVFKNKIVLIGSTASGLGDSYVTPITTSESGPMSGPELTANVTASILNQDFYTRPGWAPWAEFGVLLAVTLYLMFAMPRLGALTAANISGALLAGLIASEIYLLAAEKLWLHQVSPGLLLLFGHLALTTKRYLLTERLKTEAETDSAQNNRMLGLSFQSQGQLDMAMDKFRKLPVDESVLELIYNLALDFERKRQFHKAAAAYDYVVGHDPQFRDVAERKKRSLQMESTIVLGGKAAAPGGTMILEGVDQKPTLGRYQIEKELGKGAMGTVYLGRDPKINRVVAIKTMALSAEFEASELKEVKERFFREAETAGRLNHPNIVTMYDAGEEQDLAYIAMEFLQGKDLTQYIGPDKPRPIPWVINVVARVADALAYAHKNDVVHRDIKPANIMYNEADDSIKVTDFGIARITAASKTKTGVVLGTPSYMSPEQLAGKHVDGRSDLFSLGAMLYEMLAGKPPFTGDSLATLMFCIVNEKHPDIKAVRPDTPPCLRAIIDRALQKDAEKRYQTGDEFRQDLLKCLSKLPATDAKAP